MISPETNARLLRLEHTRGWEIHDILTKILEKGEALENAAVIVEEKLASGEGCLFGPVALLVSRTKSESLYLLIKSPVFEKNDVESLLHLYKEQYPDPAIEKKLAELLYGMATGRTQWPGTYLPYGGIPAILRAMTDVGSTVVLPTLEAVRYEISPSVSTKTSLADAIRSNINQREESDPTLEEVKPLIDEMEALLVFDPLLEAIRAIKDRSSKQLDSPEQVIVGGSPQGRLGVTGGLQRPLTPEAELSALVQRITDAITHGESKVVEFKETLGVNLRTNSQDEAIEDSALKTIVAFLNTEGGMLLIGVDDGGNIKGLDPDLKFKRNSKDKLYRYLKDLIKTRIGVQFFTYLDYSIVPISGTEILIVDCRKSATPCFLHDKEFYVRTGPSSDRLEGPKTHQYISNHFRSGF